MCPRLWMSANSVTKHVRPQPPMMMNPDSGLNNWKLLDGYKRIGSVWLPNVRMLGTLIWQRMRVIKRRTEKDVQLRSRLIHCALHKCEGGIVPLSRRNAIEQGARVTTEWVACV